MTRFRKILLVTASALALCGAQACTSDTELNPQPLPPADPTRSPDGKEGSDNGGGSSGATNPGSADAAAPDGGGDGGDGGTAEASDQ
jgi:hypothetical protein